jgi:protein-S-isoprenylcysteine O-methyltransferase Ste14
MLVSHLYFGIAWIVYCGLHSILATALAKTFFRPVIRQYYRLFYSMIAIGGLVALLAWQINLPTIELWQKNSMLKVAGLIISFLGFSMMLYCLRKYFVSHRGYRELLTENQQPVFVFYGMNRWVRHPLYFSTFIFLWSLLLVFPLLSFLIANSIITIYTLIGIRFEEKKLVKTFGQAYIDYQRKVPMIIPGVKSF